MVARPAFEASHGDLILIRFSPASLAGIVRGAEAHCDQRVAGGLPPQYAVSTFGDVKTQEETVDELVVRVCGAADAGGRTIWLAVADQLREDGFELVASPPPPYHYDVIIGDELDHDRAAQLVARLELGRRRNPAWAK